MRIKTDIVGDIELQQFGPAAAPVAGLSPPIFVRHYGLRDGSRTRLKNRVLLFGNLEQNHPIGHDVDFRNLDFSRVIADVIFEIDSCVDTVEITPKTVVRPPL